MTGSVTSLLERREVRTVELTIDGIPVKVPEGATILQACRALQIDTPTLCYLETLHPVNVCRVCVVEVEGSRLLVPACSRMAESGMVVRTDTDRVRHSRKLVLELLGSSVDMSCASDEIHDYFVRYGAETERFGPKADPDVTGDRDVMRAGHHTSTAQTATVHQQAKIDNELYIRDYSRCILCYRCVEACGVDHQNTFAIAIAGRGFDARVSTEFVVPLPDSACVYCGNCIAVCPTGALMFKSEHDLREADAWRQNEQTITETICSYCGIGCPLELHVQDNRIVKVTSPLDHDITSGNLCIKGRFGWQFVQNFADETNPADPDR